MVQKPLQLPQARPYQSHGDRALLPVQALNALVSRVVGDPDARDTVMSHSVHRSSVSNVMTGLLHSTKHVEEERTVACSARRPRQRQEVPRCIVVATASQLPFVEKSRVRGVRRDPLRGDPVKVVKQPVPQRQNIKDLDRERTVKIVFRAANQPAVARRCSTASGGLEPGEPRASCGP